MQKPRQASLLKKATLLCFISLNLNAAPVPSNVKVAIQRALECRGGLDFSDPKIKAFLAGKEDKQALALGESNTYLVKQPNGIKVFGVNPTEFQVSKNPTGQGGEGYISIFAPKDAKILQKNVRPKTTEFGELSVNISVGKPDTADIVQVFCTAPGTAGYD